MASDCDGTTIRPVQPTELFSVAALGLVVAANDLRKCQFRRSSLAAGIVAENGPFLEQDRSTVVASEGPLLLSGQKVAEHGCQLFSETTRSGDGFKLPVDILRITLLPNAYSTDNDHVLLRIDTIDYAVVCELVFPIASQRAAQR